MNEQLPMGWLAVALPQVATLNMGQSPPSSTYNTEGRGLPFFQGKAEFGDLYPEPDKFCSAPNKVAEPRDILISVRAPVGPTNMCRERCCIGRGLAAIRTRHDVLPHYLLFYLRSIEAWLATQGTGSTFTAISKSDLEQLRLPLAPLPEQRRIVAKLEALLAKVDACQQRLAKIPLLLKRFRQSVLAAACSGRLTADWRKEDGGEAGDTDLPGSWKSVEFGELISDGPQNGLYKPASFYGDGTLIVRIDAFYDGTIAAWHSLKRLRLTDKERSQFALQNGDILVNRVNSPKFLGKSALVRKLKEPCIYESNMMRLRLDSSRATPDYAILYLQSLSGLLELRQNARHAVNQSSINQEDVKSAMFNLPPLPEQHEIVRRVENLFALADQIEARYTKAQQQVDKLTPSLLAKAFRGELVPQDANDEPASKLLERIKLARE